MLDTRVWTLLLGAFGTQVDRNEEVKMRMNLWEHGDISALVERVISQLELLKAGRSKNLVKVSSESGVNGRMEPAKAQ